jgi:C1A family cysteine protease
LISVPIKIQRYGWIPDLPDVRDYSFAAPREVLVKLPPSVDLRSQCPSVYDQGELGSCTANAIAAAIEFDLMKQKQKSIFIPSRLFLYYNERVMEGTVASDSGAQIRDGIKSVSKQGDCPENLWPYDVAKFAKKPPQTCYKSATKYTAVNYQSVTQDSNQLKGCLASGYPFVFGFTVYDSFESKTVAKTGNAPMPKKDEKTLGGHAVMAVGYDDSKQWFVVRNSWGPNWGMQGYFTLPYNYVGNSKLASDFWTIRVMS